MAAREEEDKFGTIFFTKKKERKKHESRAVWELRERGTEKVPEDSRSVVLECVLDRWLTHIHTHSQGRAGGLESCDKMHTLLYSAYTHS